MKRMIILLSLLAQLAGTNAHSEEWEQQASEQGITVEARSLPDSDIKAFRASVRVKAHVESVLALMDDPNSYPHWIHGCSRSVFFDQPDLFRRMSYQVNDMPLWVTDRDLAMEVTVTPQDTGAFRIDLRNKPEAYPDKGLVRLNRLRGTYYLNPNPDGGTDILWQQHAEPGGYLPSWLVNQLLHNIPIKSLSDLRKLVDAEDSPYRDRRLLRNELGEVTGWAN